MGANAVDRKSTFFWFVENKLASLLAGVKGLSKGDRGKRCLLIKVWSGVHGGSVSLEHAARMTPLREHFLNLESSLADRRLEQFCSGGHRVSRSCLRRAVWIFEPRLCTLWQIADLSNSVNFEPLSSRVASSGPSLL